MDEFADMSTDDLNDLYDRVMFERQVRMAVGPQRCGAITYHGPYPTWCKLLKGHTSDHDSGTFEEADKNFMDSMRAGAEHQRAVDAEAARRLDEIGGD